MSEAGDRDNFSGDISITAPTGGVTRGSVYKIEDRVVVARETKDAGESFLAAVEGPVEVTKSVATGDAFSALDAVYANTTDNDVQATAATTGDTPIGYALETAAVATTSVLIQLGGSIPTVS